MQKANNKERKPAAGKKEPLLAEIMRHPDKIEKAAKEIMKSRSKVFEELAKY